MHSWGDSGSFQITRRHIWMGVTINKSLILSLLMFFQGMWTMFNFFLLISSKKTVTNTQIGWVRRSLHVTPQRDQEALGEHLSQFFHWNSSCMGCSLVLLKNRRKALCVVIIERPFLKNVHTDNLQCSPAQIMTATENKMRQRTQRDPFQLSPTTISRALTV